MVISAKDAVELVEKFNTYNENVSAEDFDRKSESAEKKAKKILPGVFSKIKKAAGKGETFCIVQEQTGYSRTMHDLDPVHAVMGEPRKDASLRRRPDFSKLHSWRYISEQLEEQGFQVSFERSITTLDELGKDVYMLVAYWDNV